jgi:hypothetical protein
MLNSAAAQHRTEGAAWPTAARKCSSSKTDCFPTPSRDARKCALETRSSLRRTSALPGRVTGSDLQQSWRLIIRETVIDGR